MALHLLLAAVPFVVVLLRCIDALREAIKSVTWGGAEMLCVLFDAAK
jgi:hypothetical protein